MPPSHKGLEPLVNALDEFQIPYLIGGSVASSVFGIPRATNDVDFLAAIRLNDVRLFVERLSREFIAFEDDISSAVRLRRPFNLIHRESVDKYDIFPPQNAFDRAQLQRACRLTLTFFGTELKVAIASPEDVVISKLLWFRQGGEVSDRQWSDISGVVQTQTGKLDLEYLNRWANELAIADLLAKALKTS